METAVERRSKRDKGHTSYHPDETFMLSVDWILRNQEVAEGMLRDGLALCSKATARDTPCVPLYFFRVAYDQTQAKEYESTVQNLGDHPHYAKNFKSLEMGIPLVFCQNKLKAGGIDATPLALGATTPFDDALKKQLGFAPVVLSLTELYLDSRSFFEHADSPDYLKAYGTIMEGHRSLTATSRCFGTPTETMFNTVLEPYLQAQRGGEHLLQFSQFSNTSASAADTVASKPFPLSAFLEFSVSQPDIPNWKEVVLEVFDALSATVRMAAMVDGRLRVETTFVWPETDAGITRACDALKAFPNILAGQLFVFSDKTVSRPHSLPSQLKFHYCHSSSKSDEYPFFFKGSDSEFCCAGYLMHPVVGQLQPDRTVTYKREPKD